MKNWSLVALLLGVLLVAAPFSQQFANASDEYEDDDDDAASGSGDDEEKDVVVVTTANFPKTIGASKFALVEFYAPWCGHCQKLKPEWAKAATALKKSAPDVVIAKLDATEQSELGTKFGVQGYPTIKWFVDGEFASDYNGGRDADGIAKWVLKKAGPAAVTVESADKLAELEKTDEVIIVGYFAALKGAEYDVFKKVAQSTEDALFVETTSADVAKAAGFDAKPGVIVIKNFKGEDRQTVIYAGDFLVEDLKVFANGEKLPLTIEFNDGNSQKIFNSGIEKQLLLVGNEKDLKASTATMKAYKAAAAAYKGRLIFVTVTADTQAGEPVVNYFGLKSATLPVVVGFHMSKNKKYKLNDPLEAENIKKFAQSLEDGSAVPEYKSAAIPEEDKDEDVQIVVGNSFESIVLNPEKDVLLEVYAPWCGHCKKLDPIYKKLAKRFAKVESVVIAKMDGTENEHPDVEVKGFPTVLFYPAGQSKTAISFEGTERGLKELTKFIKQHAKIPYELPKKGGGAGSEKDEL